MSSISLFQVCRIEIRCKNNAIKVILQLKTGGNIVCQYLNIDFDNHSNKPSCNPSTNSFVLITSQRVKWLLDSSEANKCAARTALTHHSDIVIGLL